MRRAKMTVWTQQRTKVRSMIRRQQRRTQKKWTQRKWYHPHGNQDITDDLESKSGFISNPTFCGGTIV